MKSKVWIILAFQYPTPQPLSSCFSCEISPQTNSSRLLFSCRHKRVWGHQRQGALVSERAVHQHRGFVQVHLFAGLRGLRRATQMHPRDPRVWAGGDRKLRQTAGLSCSLKDHLTPLCPSPRGPGTKPPTVTLRRPNSFPYTHTYKQKRTQNTFISPSHTFKRTRNCAVNVLHGI